MKKKSSILHTLILPYMLVILLFPIAVCSIFYYTASRNAMNEAKSELTELKDTVIPLMNEAFTEDNDLIPRERVGSFVRTVSPVISRNSGDGKIILFADEFKVVYPRDDTDKS